MTHQNTPEHDHSNPANGGGTLGTPDNPVKEAYLNQLQVEEAPEFNPANTYSPSNDLTDRTFDADNTTVAELADVVATLIRDLGMDN